MAKRFNIPFATTGDKTEIPDEVQPDGSVSYAQGFGIDYEREYTDPLSKDIARESMNQVLSDVTGAVGEIQANGVAPFSEDSKPYPQWAIVNHPTGAYISRIDNNNNDIPHSSWMQLGGTGSNDVRTNSQNEDKFVTTDTVQTLTAAKNWNRSSTGAINQYFSYSSDDIDGHVMSLVLTEYAELDPNNWPELPAPTTHILRYRRGGSSGNKNIEGIAFGSSEAKPALILQTSRGVAFGNPDGGLRGLGTINAEEIYKDGQPVNSNSQNDSRFWQRSQLTFSLSGTTLTITDNS